MQVRKEHKVIIGIIIILVIPIAIYFLIDEYHNDNGSIITTDPSDSGSGITNLTGDTDVGNNNGIVIQPSKQELSILSGFVMRKENPLPQDYPQVIFQDLQNIKNPILVIDATFTSDFINNYQYDESNSYFFALKVFLGRFDNGGYFNVFRNESGGVRNSSSIGLNGAKTGQELRKGVVREIPLFKSIRLAVESDERSPNFGYKYFNFKNYILSNQGNPINIGAYLSSTKEKKGWNILKINEMKIIYEGYEGDISLNTK